VQSQDTSVLLFPSFIRAIVHYDNSSSCEKPMYCLDWRPRAKSFAQPVSTHSIRMRICFRRNPSYSIRRAIQPQRYRVSARHIATMDWAPGVASQSICEVLLFSSQREQPPFCESAIGTMLLYLRYGQEACDWPSQNVTVQLITEKAVGTR